MRAAQPSPITDFRKTLRVAETAKALGISPASVWKLVYGDATFPVVRIHGTVLVSVKGLDEWIAARTRGNGTNSTEEA